MQVAVSTSNKIFSKIIRGLTGAKASHFILIFDDKFVIHINVLGLRFDWKRNFLRENTIVDSLHLVTNLDMEEEVYRGIVDSFTGEERYDWKAILYSGWCHAKRRFFGTPIPKVNAWAAGSGVDLCLEIAKALPDWLCPIKQDSELAMMLPEQLFEIIAQNYRTREEQLSLKV